MPTPLVWREPFRVRFYEAEPSGRAAIPALCRYLQQAADGQCRSLGLSLSELHEVGRMWVLVRFALTVQALPHVGETVFVETWPSSRLNNLRAYRDFRLRHENNQLLAEASSLWLLLDKRTRRPVRLPEEVLALRHDEQVTAEPVDSIPLIAPESGMLSSFTVRWRDLDANGHANNVCYIEWLLETIPHEIRAGSMLTGLDIQFHNEILLGEEVRCFTDVANTPQRSAFRHKLTDSSERLLAVACTSWGECD